jgi:3,4-dihydroxy 2-butanone 4-phosphate synthase/GTP cyclohydrolase II
MNTVQEAIDDIKLGKIVIVVDDENRENEGDFVTAARNATPEIINFMATHGRGLICAPLIEERCDELDLNLMVDSNNSHFDTPFTVSVDLIGKGCSTGISTADRAKTVKALINPKTKSKDLGKPGHIFPLRAKTGGVLRRAGHTEAAVDLSRLSGFEPAGLIVEIMNEDGSMARLPELKKIALKFDIKIITIEDLIAYRMKHETLIEKIVEVNLPTKYGEFKLAAFKQTTTSEEHLALIKGTWTKNESISVRVHSSCFTGDILGSLRCDCGDQLASSMKMIEEEGKGVVVYMNQEGRGIGLINKLQAYKLQEQGYDTLDANLALGFKGDSRDYGVGAQILKSVGVSKMKLLSNNPKKRTGLIGYGLEITEIISIQGKCNKHNAEYLKTKKKRMGHNLDL